MAYTYIFTFLFHLPCMHPNYSKIYILIWHQNDGMKNRQKDFQFQFPPLYLRPKSNLAYTLHFWTKA
jgi:hypothetical protein